MKLPAVPEGANPYLVWIQYLRVRFLSPPTAGFRARLIVLWVLAGYGIVAAALYSLALFSECRTRGNSFWLWRFVRRPNGRYIVGNQRTLFALFSAIACGVYIAYFSSFYTMYLEDGTGSGGAMFWRLVSWLPAGLHLYISSWANLQAAIISSQVVAGRQLLGPIPLNTAYIGGALVGVIAIVTLSLVGSIYWTQIWSASKALGAALFAYAVEYPNDSLQVANGRIAPLLAKVNHYLDPFTNIIRAASALIAAGALLVIAINFGGFAVLLALHRQIKFNLIEEITESQPFIGPPSCILQLDPPRHRHRWLRCSFPLPWGKRQPADGKSSPTSERAGSSRIVFNKRELPTKTLERIARDMSPINSTNRQKAMRLLELRKTERDVLALLLVIVLLASLYGAMEMWFAIDPYSAGKNWHVLEVAYFLVPWTYLCTVDGVLTFLLINTLRHSGPTTSFGDGPCVGVGGGLSMQQSQARPVMQQHPRGSLSPPQPPRPVLNRNHSHAHSHGFSYSRSNSSPLIEHQHEHEEPASSSEKSWPTTAKVTDGTEVDKEKRASSSTSGMSRSGILEPASGIV